MNKKRIRIKKQKESKIEVGVDGSYINYKLVRVENVPSDALELLVQLVDGYNDEWDQGEDDTLKVAAFWRDIVFQNESTYLIVAPKKFSALKNDLNILELKFKVIQKNLQDIISKQKSTQHSCYNTQLHNLTWKCFHPYSDFESYFEYLLRNFPKLVFIDKIGKSYEGRDLSVVKVCRGGCSKSRPALWIESGIHGEEWLGPASVSFLIKELVENDQNHPELTEKLEWYFLPIMNPDGYSYTWTNDSQRLWRKSRSKFSNGDDCKGVDLDQNFGEAASVFTDFECSDFFRGPHAFSEPEPQSVSRYLQTISTHLKFYNSVHGFGQTIQIPSVCGADSTESDRLVSIISNASDSLFFSHRRRFQIQCIPVTSFPSIVGSWLWASTSLKVPYSIRTNLRDNGESGHLILPTEINSSGEELWAFHEALANTIIEEIEK